MFATILQIPCNLCFSLGGSIPGLIGHVGRAICEAQVCELWVYDGKNHAVFAGSDIKRRLICRKRITMCLGSE